MVIWWYGDVMLGYNMMFIAQHEFAYELSHAMARDLSVRILTRTWAHSHENWKMGTPWYMATWIMGPKEDFRIGYGPGLVLQPPGFFTYLYWCQSFDPDESMPDVGVLGEDGLDLLEQCLNYKAPQLGEGGYLDVLSGCRLDCSEF